MPIVANQELYNEVKKYADTIYEKPSAYKSGFIVKTYKKLGGEYLDDKEPKNLKRWYKEAWESIANKDEYPVYRPTKRITKDTPLTINEIDPKQAIEQIELKQIIKGNANLPKFKSKELINITNVPKSNIIWNYSNPIIVRKKADIYLGKNVPVYLSTNTKKKYMVYDPSGKLIHFGGMNPPMQDLTHHRDEKRRQNYLTRTANIRGNWKDNKYSANNLSRAILWDS